MGRKISLGKRQKLNDAARLEKKEKTKRNNEIKQKDSLISEL